MIIFICIIILGFLSIFLRYKYIYYLAKKCNYNCKICKVFDCPAKYCYCHFIISSKGTCKKYCEEVILNDKRK